MCYKADLQRKNEEKLQGKFAEDSVPMFIREAVVLRISSRQARLNAWATVKTMLLWMITKKYINKNNIGELTCEDLDAVIPMQMAEYLEFLLVEKRISKPTLVTKKNQLSSFWSKLKERHYVMDNIVALADSAEFKPAKTNRQKAVKQPLPEDIADMMENINHIKNDFLRIRNSCIIRVLRGTGLRKSELIGLDDQDIYLDEKYIDARHPRPYILVTSKGTYDYSDDGKDIVFLTKDATEALYEWYKLKNTLKNIATESVFVNRDGTRIGVKTLRKIFEKYGEDKITPHMMRHGYAMELQRESNDPVFVQEQGRWKSQAMLRNVYDSGATRSIGALDKM